MLVGCSDEGGTSEVAATGSTGVLESSGDPRLDEARAALMRGDLAVARGLANKLDEAEVDVTLLFARIAFVEGDDAEALRLVEVAKQAAPNDGRPFATAAELFAARGRSLEAEEALRSGWNVAGRSPELERARGVMLLSQPGGSIEGLKALEGAREARPGLAYLRLPLAQANLLVGRRLLGLAQVDAAEKHANAALELDPTGVDTRELAAEVHTAQRRFEAALEIYDELASEGLELTAMRIDLHVKAATSAILFKDNDSALEHYLRARDLGATDDELGHGVTVLSESAVQFVSIARSDLRSKRFAQAQSELSKALERVPDHLEAWSLMGHACFGAGDSLGAAEAWSVVVDLAGAETELPEPVVVNLAKAYRTAGRLDSAIDALESYLEQRPEDRWRLEAADLLTILLSERARVERGG